MKLVLLTAVAAFGLGYCAHTPDEEMSYSEETAAAHADLIERSVMEAEQHEFGADYLTQLVAKKEARHAQ